MFSEWGSYIWVYLEDEELKVQVEELDGKVFMHLTLYYTTPSILKRVKEGIPDLVSLLKERGHEVVYGFTKNYRLAEFLGRNYLAYDKNGYHIYEW